MFLILISVLNDSSFYILSSYFIFQSKSSHSMLGQHRQVIFKEDMFGVIENAHKNNERHRGYKGTFNKVHIVCY